MRFGSGYAAGYREACEVARKRLEAVAVDHSAEPDAFRQDLLNIARTTLSSKILTQVGLRSDKSLANCTVVRGTVQLRLNSR